MRSIVRVKREERKGANNSSTEREQVVQKGTPEMIVRSWIAASRERRRAEAVAYQRNFTQWNEKLCLSSSQ